MLLAVVFPLRDFGTKIISIKPILKQLQALLEDRDKTVRDETKQLAVEIYRWIGPALKPQLTNLKPLQVRLLLTGYCLHSFGHFYSAPSSPLLFKGAPDYSTDTVS